MERKKNILCALMLMFAASASFTHANAHETELREVNPNDCVCMQPYMWRETASFMLMEPQALQQI